MDAIRRRKKPETQASILRRDFGGVIEVAEIKFIRLLTFLLMVAGQTALHAGPPLSTGDVPTATRGTLEIYAGQRYQENPDGTLGRETSMELAYGLNDRLEASFELPCISEESARGWGDVTIGTKYVFKPETAATPGVAGSLKYEVPSASAARGLGRGAAVWAVRLRMQKTWARLTGMANLGYTVVNEPVISGIKRARENPWFVAAAEEYKLSKKTILVSELYWQTREKPGAFNRLAYNVGFKQKLAPNFRIHGAIGGSLRQGDAGGPQLRLFLGFKYELAVRPRPAL